MIVVAGGATEQEAVVPPFEPTHVQAEPETGVGLPETQVPEAEPQTPLIGEGGGPVQSTGVLNGAGGGAVIGPGIGTTVTGPGTGHDCPNAGIALRIMRPTVKRIVFMLAS